MSIQSDYNRRFGQLKRLLKHPDVSGIDYEKPKKITRDSINRINKLIKEAQRQISVAQAKGEYEEILEEQPRKDGDTLADVRAIRNLKVTLSKAVNKIWDGMSYSNMAKTYCDNVTGAIKTMIDNAITEHSYAWVRERLKKFSTSFRKDLERLALAVIDTGDGGYNTNENPWKKDEKGDAGRNRFTETLDSLSDCLKQPVPVWEVYGGKKKKKKK